MCLDELADSCNIKSVDKMNQIWQTVGNMQITLPYKIWKSYILYTCYEFDLKRIDKKDQTRIK